jgi:NAD-dependent dihydropyrimidine dehydrogenase PreA subunit
MDRQLPVIDPAECTGCVACVDACTHACLEMQDGVAALTNPAACTNDQNCMAACPTDAIHMGPAARP